MKSGTLFVLVPGVFVMFGMHRVMSEGGELPMEDGVVSAKTLPLDEEMSKVAYQTATFGMG